MFLVELVMQGVRGVRELARLRFQGGFNFIAAANEAGKTTAADTLVRLLFPSNRPGKMEPLISRQTPDASRGALVVYANDNAYYRVIQDFSKRAVNLSKYNADTKDFALLQKEWDGTAAFMSGMIAGITEEEYAGLFVFTREQYAGSSVPVVSTSSPAPSAFQPKPTAPKSGQVSAQETRLVELRESLAKAEEAADADYRLQSAKLKLEETARKLESLEDINHRYADMEANLESLTGCDTLPADLPELVSSHVERQTRKMEKSDDLQQDIESLKMQIENIPSVSLVLDKLFLSGSVLGVLSLAAGLFVPNKDVETYFPLGVLASLVLVAVGLYGSSRRSAQRKMFLKETEDLELELAELEKSFEQGGATILACMQATGSTTVEELKEKADTHRHYLSLRNDIDEQRTRMLGGVSYEALTGEYAKEQQEVIELEKAAAAVAPYAVDTYSLRQEIERIESETSGVSFDFGSMGSGPAPDFGAPLSPETRQQGTALPELLVASRVSGIEMETLVPAVEAAAQRTLVAITGGKYVRIEVGQEGAPVVHDKLGAKIASSELSHGTRDLLYFCLRVGLIEAVAGKLRLPFILDDPLAGFDPARQQAACQMLRGLGAKTQVLLFSSNPGLRAAGDVASELK